MNKSGVTSKLLAVCCVVTVLVGLTVASPRPAQAGFFGDLWNAVKGAVTGQQVNAPQAPVKAPTAAPTQVCTPGDDYYVCVSSNNSSRIDRFTCNPQGTAWGGAGSSNCYSGETCTNGATGEFPGMANAIADLCFPAGTTPTVTPIPTNTLVPTSVPPTPVPVCTPGTEQFRCGSELAGLFSVFKETCNSRGQWDSSLHSTCGSGNMCDTGETEPTKNELCRPRPTPTPPPSCTMTDGEGGSQTVPVGSTATFYSSGNNCNQTDPGLAVRNRYTCGGPLWRFGTSRSTSSPYYASEESCRRGLENQVCVPGTVEYKCETGGLGINVVAKRICAGDGGGWTSLPATCTLNETCDAGVTKPTLDELCYPKPTPTPPPPCQLTDPDDSVPVPVNSYGTMYNRNNNCAGQSTAVRCGSSAWTPGSTLPLADPYYATSQGCTAASTPVCADGTSRYTCLSSRNSGGVSGVRATYRRETCSNGRAWVNFGDGTCGNYETCTVGRVESSADSLCVPISPTATPTPTCGLCKSWDGSSCAPANEGSTCTPNGANKCVNGVCTAPTPIPTRTPSPTPILSGTTGCPPCKSRPYPGASCTANLSNNTSCTLTYTSVSAWCQSGECVVRPTNTPTPSRTPTPVSPFTCTYTCSTGNCPSGYACSNTDCSSGQQKCNVIPRTPTPTSTRTPSRTPTPTRVPPTATPTPIPAINCNSVGGWCADPKGSTSSIACPLNHGQRMDTECGDGNGPGPGNNVCCFPPSGGGCARCEASDFSGAGYERDPAKDQFCDNSKVCFRSTAGGPVNPCAIGFGDGIGKTYCVEDSWANNLSYSMSQRGMSDSQIKQTIEMYSLSTSACGSTAGGSERRFDLQHPTIPSGYRCISLATAPSCNSDDGVILMTPEDNLGVGGTASFFIRDVAGTEGCQVSVKTGLASCTEQLNQTYQGKTGRIATCTITGNSVSWTRNWRALAPWASFKLANGTSAEKTAMCSSGLINQVDYSSCQKKLEFTVDNAPTATPEPDPAPACSALTTTLEFVSNTDILLGQTVSLRGVARTTEPTAKADVLIYDGTRLIKTLSSATAPTADGGVIKTTASGVTSYAYTLSNYMPTAVGSHTYKVMVKLTGSNGQVSPECPATRTITGTVQAELNNWRDKYVTGGTSTQADLDGSGTVNLEDIRYWWNAFK